MTAMMSGMQEMSKAARARSGPTPEFVELCKTLYGDVVDPEVVWTDVIKLSPDQADLNAQRNKKIRRNVERGSNAVGIAAGTLGLAAALKDPRLKSGGRVARAMYRTGERMPEVASRIATKRPRAGGALAAGAVATQVGNLTGDGLIAGTLSEDGSPRRRRRQSVDKAAGTGVRDIVDGIKLNWSKLTPTGGKLPSGPPTARIAPKAPAPVQGVDLGAQMRTASKPPASRKEAKAVREATSRASTRESNISRGQSVGNDVGRALSTTSGKVAAGGVALYGANKLGGRRSSGQGEYVDPMAYYGKADDGLADVTWHGEFSKFDDDKRLAFGWASVVKINGQPVVDRQGDYIDLEDLENAAYEYVHKSRVGGDMHKRTQSLSGDQAHKVSDMVESIVFTPDKIAKMGLPDDFPQGWWVGYRIHDDETWGLVRKGLRTGFSIHGKGIRKEQSLDEVMGYR